jgi:tripartite-type tricarboxylate transporter receptor subunit TctC
MKLRSILIVGLFSTLAGYCFEASAQGYPERSVTIIVPFPAGGATDVVARVLGAKLSERLGQQFIIENRAGANGAVGSAAVARAAADGYTLVMGGVNTHAMNDALMKKPLYNSKTDFAPIAVTARIPIAIVTHPSLNVSNLAEIVALAKASPGKLAYGSSGTGGPHHLAMEMFKTAAGIDIVHVAYRGGAPQLNDLIGGHIKIGVIGLPPALELIKSGQLTAIAAVEDKRSTMLPDLPTVAELGYPGFAVLYWMGLLAPAKTPEAIVNKLHENIVAALAAPDLREQLNKQGAEVVVSTPAEFAALIAVEIPKWAEVVRKAGASVEN